MIPVNIYITCRKQETAIAYYVLWDKEKYFMRHRHSNSIFFFLSFSRSDPPVFTVTLNSFTCFLPSPLVRGVILYSSKGVKRNLHQHRH